MSPQKEQRLFMFAILYIVGAVVMYFSYNNLDVKHHNGRNKGDVLTEKGSDHGVQKIAKVHVTGQMDDNLTGRSDALNSGMLKRVDAVEEVRGPGQSINAKDDTMHLAFIVFGNQGVFDAYTLICSMVMLTQGRINFHIFSPDNSGVVIERKIQDWHQEYRDQVTITKYTTVCPVWKTKAVNLPRAYRNTGAKICAYETLLNSDIRRVTERVIYMDIDIIALDDLKNLWSQFNRFNTTQMMGSIQADIRYLHDGYEFRYGDYGLNGGVLMMDLTKMVDIGFLTEYFAGFDRKYRKNYNRDDQDMLNVYFSRHPDRMLNLSRSYNARHSIDSCGSSPHRCYESEQEGVKFLHACVAAVFTKSAYTPIYNCMQNIDFIDVEKSFTCLESGIKSFIDKRLKDCPTHGGFMNSLKASLLNSITSYNTKFSKQFTLNF